ncbi:MAG: flagellar protein FlgN [Lachnospiraceae bacterium]|nr:flagellar protein FlgN [Lachnospiraceae bacterium]
MENLIEVLNRESSEYDRLLELSSKKTGIIAKNNIDELQKIMDDEQEVISRIGNLEKKREETTKDIANVLNKDVNALKLTDLIQILSARPEEQRALSNARDKIQTVTAAVRRVNEQNAELLKNAMEMVEFEINLLTAMKAAPETANYNRGAYSSGMELGTARSGFDAKQ